MLQISVLGAVEVTRDGRRVAVPGGKTAELLVRLALEAGVLVRTDRIVEEVWAEDAVNTQRNTLQSKVARLRRGLGDPALIATGEAGYTLAVDPAEVDALSVLSDAAGAAERLSAGDARGAAELSSAALARFRGDLLPAAGEWAQPYRARLEEARMALTETQLAARLRLGDAVVGELESAVAAYPYREGLWELLITALYRTGRQADALATYQRVRARLADDLGLAPGPALQQLERAVLDHEPALDPPAGNLPSLAAELVGREAEIAAVRELLEQRRLVEIVGPGGIGKTALAIATGRTLPGGVWLVRLETATTADDVLDAVIAALDVTGGEPALLERLKSVGVVILDNCEHVADAAAVLVERALDAAPGLRILCTSQVPLDVDGEAVFELSPLAISDAVELFTQRATTRRADQPEAVRELCRSLDGLPLAIELAAARTKTLSIGEISRRLDDRFTVLSDPTSRRPERRRALKATIGWSYELLFPDDKRGLWALATFAGGAPLPAVESVLAALDVPASAAIDVVGRLASRSLLIVDDGERYRLLDSIRAFALDAMAEAGLTQRALAAHAAWFAAAADSSTAGVRSADQAEYLAFARTERANIDAALASSDALRIVNGFGWAWIVLGDTRGAQRILTALAAADDAPAADRANALLLASWMEASTGQLELAREHIAAASELAPDDARCDYYLAYVVSHDGAWEQALELTARAASRLQDPWDQAANALFATRAAISAGDRERAATARDAVEHWLQTVDDPWLHVRRDAMLGELARVEHRFDDAVRHIGRAAEASGRRGYLQTEAYQLSSLGRAQCQAGDYETGAATLELAIEKAEATGDVRLAALARVHLGRVLRALGRDARPTLDAAVAWHREAGGGEQAALGEVLLAALNADKPRLVALLEQARRAGDAPVEVFALDALGRTQEADERMPAASHFITQRDRVDAPPRTQATR
ncbi:winged helix-turn-helix domain-containing protein [Solirubrobacter taibaiensis]|nr:winged helix-turn-helix domain-containing protein [Solirubrobacter taibaiensis]